MSLADEAVLATDPTFISRVKASMVNAAVAIANEGFTILWHKQRADLGQRITFQPDTYKVLFASTVATDPTVISDATQGSTVALTGNNVAAQAALVTDAHINAAIAGQWNTYINVP